PDRRPAPHRVDRALELGRPRPGRPRPRRPDRFAASPRAALRVFSPAAALTTVRPGPPRRCGPRHRRASTKGEIDVERQNPSGPKPPSDDPNKTESASAWISPRLREKLMEAESGMPREKEGGLPPWIPIVLVVLVLGGGGGLLLAMRAGAAREKAEALKKAET